MKFEFTDKEKERIKTAVKSLEDESSGEIVPYFVSSSDSYDEAKWISALLITILGVIFTGGLAYFWLLPSGTNTLIICTYLFFSAIFGFLAPMLFPSLGTLLISDAVQVKRIKQRAFQAFLSEEVFKTIDRTGILIFISADEQKVVVLADSGINEKVKDSDWDHIVHLVVTGIKNDQLTSGLVSAINECKKLLLDNGFIVRSDDTNELPDDIRFEV
jgi:putative membrane protein